MEVKIRWHDGVGCKATEGFVRRECQAQKLLAERMLDAVAIKELLSKKW